MIPALWLSNVSIGMFLSITPNKLLWYQRTRTFQRNSQYLMWHRDNVVGRTKEVTRRRARLVLGVLSIFVIGQSVTQTS